MSVWKGAISFGLVYIPVIMESAQQDQPLSFTTLDKRNFAPVGYKHYNKKTGEEVSRDEIVKGYEYEKNNFALVTNEELKSVARKKSEVLQIEDFVEVKEIDPTLFYRPYFLIPQRVLIITIIFFERPSKRRKRSALEASCFDPSPIWQQ